MTKKLINFDKLLVVCDCSAIRVVRRNVFSENVTKKVLRYKDPEFKLDIIVDFGHDTFSLEFTSSILRENMKELINAENIRRCFENINKLNVVALEIDYILEHAVVCKADVTMDKSADDLFIKELVAYTKLYLLNNHKFLVEDYSSNGMVLRQISKSNSKQRKHRMIVYNKQKEYENSYKDKASYVPGLFNGIYRIERNLVCKAQIREALNITGCSINEVLNSSVNPFLPLYEKMVDIHKKPVYVASERREKEIRRRVERNNWDIRKIEEELRGDYKLFLTKMLLPYKRFIYENSNTKDKTFTPEIIEFFSLPTEMPRLF